jgi:hypothetical protein
MTWAHTFLRTLKENDVRLVTYVPDNVLTPLIDGAAADNYFMSIGATLEDEAVGSKISTCSAAWGSLARARSVSRWPSPSAA